MILRLNGHHMQTELCAQDILGGRVSAQTARVGGRAGLGPQAANTSAALTGGLCLPQSPAPLDMIKSPDFLGQSPDTACHPPATDWGPGLAKSIDGGGLLGSGRGGRGEESGFPFALRKASVLISTPARADDGKPKGLQGPFPTGERGEAQRREQHVRRP